MAKPNILRLSTFKISLIAIPLNLMVSLAVLAFVYFGVYSLSRHRVDRALEYEQERLSRILAGRSQEGAREVFRQLIDDERGSSRLYAVQDADAGGLLSNFALLSGGFPRAGETIQARVARSPEGNTTEARLRAMALPGGSVGIIGRDLREQADFWAVVKPSLAIAVVGAVILSVIAGMVVSRAVLRRLGAVNDTASRILEGKLEERVPLQGGDDEFAHLAGNINAMLDRIAELMAATREVTDNLAHDLRSPLNRMRGRLELALLPGATREDAEEAVAASLADADDLLATFEALLTIARLDHGVPPDFAPLDLRALAEDIVDYYLPLAEDRGVALAVGMLDQAAVVMGDSNLLFQAFSNAVDNALRYSPPGGTIVVSVRRHEDAAEFSVADNGPGIPESRRQDVLRRFVRLDASRQEPGTGLGLSVVHAIARHHHADLLLKDNNPGLRLSIRLPLSGISD